MNDQPDAFSVDRFASIRPRLPQECAPTAFSSLRIVRGMHTDCALCAEMIFAGEVTCEVAINGPLGWRVLHFHCCCYNSWEQNDVQT